MITALVVIGTAAVVAIVGGLTLERKFLKARVATLEAQALTRAGILAASLKARETTLRKNLSADITRIINAVKADFKKDETLVHTDVVAKIETEIGKVV